MKKYFAPAVEIIEVETEQTILVESGPGGSLIGDQTDTKDSDNLDDSDYHW